MLDIVNLYKCRNLMAWWKRTKNGPYTNYANSGKWEFRSFRNVMAFGDLVKRWCCVGNVILATFVRNYYRRSFMLLEIMSWPCNYAIVDYQAITWTMATFILFIAVLVLWRQLLQTAIRKRSKWKRISFFLSKKYIQAYCFMVSNFTDKRKGSW